MKNKDASTINSSNHKNPEEKIIIQQKPKLNSANKSQFSQAAGCQSDLLPPAKPRKQPFIVLFLTFLSPLPCRHISVLMKF